MRKALIVDDHETNLYLLQSVLAANGYQVVSAADGRAALERALKDPPDLIISDILMPVMDGFTFCRLCRQDERLASVPFIFYTATYTDPRDEQLALSVGADLFLVKPVEPDVFLQRVSEVVTGRIARARRLAPAPELDEVRYLKEYSEALVRKLEDKVADVDEANRALLVKEFAIESAPSGILLTGLDGHVVYANRATATLAGRPRAALVGMALDEFFAESAAWHDARETIAARGHWAGELTTADEGDRQRTVSVAVHTVTGGEGPALCRMVSFEDVTERRRLAEEVQRSQRMASLSLFATGVAHDFNNLLMGVFGNIELAADTLPADHPAREHLKYAGVAFERARDLTRRLLTFAKGSPPFRRELNVVDLLQECCALALVGSAVTVDIVSEDGLWPLLGDANQLSQVFTNILVNARQAMSGTGAVHVAIDNHEVPGRPGAPPERSVRVTIADEGPGIAPEALAHLFDPLFSTKADGSGLGLAMSYCIVQAHGGRIEASSIAGRGATLRVYLPAEQRNDDVRRQEPRRPASETRAIQGRVLIMDDETAVRALAGRMLERDGHEVTEAVDGAQVLDLCGGAVREGRPFDVVILDLTVPGGMGGLETARRLSESHPELPVIISSGYGPDAWDADDCRPAAVLPKPYRKHELLACVRAAIAGRPYTAD